MQKISNSIVLAHCLVILTFFQGNSIAIGQESPPETPVEFIMEGCHSSPHVTSYSGNIGTGPAPQSAPTPLTNIARSKSTGPSLKSGPFQIRFFLDKKRKQKNLQCRKIVEKKIYYARTVKGKKKTTTKIVLVSNTSSAAKNCVKKPTTDTPKNNSGGTGTGSGGPTTNSVSTPTPTPTPTSTIGVLNPGDATPTPTPTPTPTFTNSTPTATFTPTKVPSGKDLAAPFNLEYMPSLRLGDDADEAWDGKGDSYATLQWSVKNFEGQVNTGIVVPGLDDPQSTTGYVMTYYDVSAPQTVYKKMVHSFDRRLENESGARQMQIQPLLTGHKYKGSVQAVGWFGELSTSSNVFEFEPAPAERLAKWKDFFKNGFADAFDYKPMGVFTEPNPLFWTKAFSLENGPLGRQEFTNGQQHEHSFVWTEGGSGR